MEIESASRQIIEGKLLACLEDENTVAVVLSKSDLDLLIISINPNALHGSVNVEQQKRLQAFRQDLIKLRNEAFRK